MSPLCPWHAAERHLVRLSQHPAKKPGAFFPLFPGEDGMVISKYKTNLHLRAALTTAGINTTLTDASGHVHELFGGHSLRVAGAQFLAAAGVEVSLIQLLGRWSSSAVERYTQQAALSVVPQVPAQVLSGAPRPQLQMVPKTVVNPASGLVTPGVAAPATSGPPERSQRWQDPTTSKRVGKLEAFIDHIESCEQTTGPGVDRKATASRGPQGDC